MANLGNGESRKPQSPSSSTSSFDVFQSQKNEIINSQKISNFNAKNTNNNPRKRRKKPTSKPTTITTTTEDTIFQLILNQIETKKPKNNFKSRTSTKSSDDLPSMTRNTNYFTPKSTIFSKSTIIEEFVVTENILNNLVESIDVKSGSKNNNNDDDDEKSATFRQASFFPSNKNNPSNPLRLNWILMIIMGTASLIIH